VNSVEISVKFESSSPPQFQWLDNINKEIDESSGYVVEVLTDEVKLKINEIGYEHLGNFTLQAECDEIEKNITIELIVEGEVVGKT
jgi:hypothetical protein